LFWLASQAISLFTELARVSIFPGDEQHWARRYGLDIVERIEVHELSVAGQGGVSGQQWRLPFGSELAARRAVEVVELAFDSIGFVRQLLDRSAGVLRFPT